MAWSSTSSPQRSLSAALPLSFRCRTLPLTSSATAARPVPRPLHTAQQNCLHCTRESWHSVSLFRLCVTLHSLQVLRFGVRAPKWWYTDRLFLGTGLVSMMGTSFTFIPIATSTIQTLLDSAPLLCSA